MRILTVRQPWAWAIIHGGKDVENRSRNIAGSYRGPVAIHAGKAVHIDAMADINIVATVALKRLFSGAGHPSTFKESPFGAIIGVVDLTGVHHSAVCPSHDKDADWPLCTRWAHRDSWHLELANPRPLAQPIPYKGALGLRELPADVANDVLGGLA
jgi:hypothetical protein